MLYYEDIKLRRRRSRRAIYMLGRQALRQTPDEVQIQVTRPSAVTLVVV
jgi:hypothetical protein